MTGFPVTINGNTYPEIDFFVRGYRTALPAMINDVATVAGVVQTNSNTASTAATTATIARDVTLTARDATIAAAAGAGVTDGDKGGIVVSSAGTVWNIKEIGGVIYTGFALNGLVNDAFVAPFAMTITSIAVHLEALTLDVTFENTAAVAYEFNTDQTALPVTTTESILTPDANIVLAKYEQIKIRFSDVATGAKDFIAIFYGTRNV